MGIRYEIDVHYKCDCCGEMLQTSSDTMEKAKEKEIQLGIRVISTNQLKHKQHVLCPKCVKAMFYYMGELRHEGVDIEIRRDFQNESNTN